MSSLLERARTALAGHYEVERELGRGGMGSVLLARDLELDRLVAIKALPPDLAVHADLRERFLRETRTAAGFNHPNIVSVHAVEEVDGLLCLVMEFVDGDTLTQRVRRGGPLSPAEAVRLLEETGWALAYAHSRGVVHRDVKPDNILIERATGRALITDFGIARSNAADGLTRVGEVIGTPQFMSPEQAAGEELDGRSDLYSLGVVGFFALTGKLPFQAPTAQALLGMHLTQPPPSVTSVRPDLPAALAAVIDRCLAKDPDDRFAGGEALVSAVEELSIAKPAVAPAVRLFHQQANQALRLALVLVVIGGVGIPRSASGDQLILTAFILAALWGLLQTLYHRARFLLRQGFSFEDVRAGFQTIADEGGAAREQLRNSEADIARHRRRLRVAAVTGGLGVVMGVAAALTMRELNPVTGIYSTTIPGLLSILVAVIMISQSIISFLTDPMRPKRFEQLSGRIWRGAAGRWLFRLAGRGIADHAAAGSGGKADTPDSLTAASGPSAMLDSLPTATRKRLGGVRRAVDELERELATMGRRERDLSTALADANATTGGDPLILADARARVITELEDARQALLVQRADLLQHLEQIRLQALRLRAGVGSVSEVQQALQAQQ
ncbi:MAG: serine/threonine-protein kinase [Gemmatimonadales bacterium]